MTPMFKRNNGSKYDTGKLYIYTSKAVLNIITDSET
jgi:hypothetical protein